MFQRPAFDMALCLGGHFSVRGTFRTRIGRIFAPIRIAFRCLQSVSSCRFRRSVENCHLIRWLPLFSEWFDNRGEGVVKILFLCLFWECLCGTWGGIC